MSRSRHTRVATTRPSGGPACHVGPASPLPRPPPPPPPQRRRRLSAAELKSLMNGGEQGWQTRDPGGGERPRCRGRWSAEPPGFAGECGLTAVCGDPPRLWSKCAARRPATAPLCPSPPAGPVATGTAVARRRRRSGWQWPEVAGPPLPLAAIPPRVWCRLGRAAAVSRTHNRTERGAGGDGGGVGVSMTPSPVDGSRRTRARRRWCRGSGILSQYWQQRTAPHPPCHCRLLPLTRFHSGHLPAPSILPRPLLLLSRSSLPSLRPTAHPPSSRHVSHPQRPPGRGRGGRRGQCGRGGVDARDGVPCRSPPGHLLGGGRGAAANHRRRSRRRCRRPHVGDAAWRTTRGGASVVRGRLGAVEDLPYTVGTCKRSGGWVGGGGVARRHESRAVEGWRHAAASAKDDTGGEGKTRGGALEVGAGCEGVGDPAVLGIADTSPQPLCRRWLFHPPPGVRTGVLPLSLRLPPPQPSSTS